ncbi:RNA 3'-terminal phosphate cyclase [Psychrobacter sp. I-STPA10]|uniref:RNA 3'-terminal phosphate cyclase n=1 Tax=Psychrobacter sp. I-STPA10 TaxID=2585769 RepID=UPI001E34C876|nr:RNA 3'-terminal phosphate cyclase [Psychrobacter sp. I-STPA10]
MATQYQQQKPLQIDGSYGEGGGQVLRTALSLSMLTGTPIRLRNIRAGRKKSGLMRQHLVCVQASQRISNAAVTGAQLGSTELTFTPQEIVAGEYHFDIGSAGSTNLVLQTLLPALLFAQSDKTNKANGTDTTATQASASTVSTVSIKGGTHNPLSPSSDFLQHAFVPMLAKLGMQVDIKLKQAGFVPVGGGEIHATITPFMRRAGMPTLQLSQRGKLQSVQLVASNVNLDYDICKRELASAKAKLAENVDETLIYTKGNKLRGIGEGNTCYAVVTHEVLGDEMQSNNQPISANVHHEVFALLGEKRTSAEKMGNRLAGLVRRYLFKSDALVDEYLTDQLLLPLALSGGGEFTARMISEHSQTQAWIIQQFLPVQIGFEQISTEKFLVKVMC